MSEAAIFAVGSVLFVMTTWATIAYGLATVHELRLRDIEKSPDVDIRAESQFTDLHVRTDAEAADPANGGTQTAKLD